MTESISNKINELFAATPSDVSVGFGYKQVAGEYTSEKVIVFGVPVKLPLSEITEKDILPSTVEIDGVAYNTDVISTKGVQRLACDNSVTNPCFPYGVPPNIQLTPNSQRQRPLLGGCGLSNFYSYGGTLGFIAKHTLTGKLVGVTNNHVMCDPGFNSTSLQFPPSFFTTGEINEIPMYQPIGDRVYDPSASAIIGQNLYVKREVRQPYVNQIDAGVISLLAQDSTGADVITTESWKQLGLDIGTTPPPFATTYELDHLLDDPNLEIASSGTRTGAKQGDCGLRIREINIGVTLPLYYTFEKIFRFTRINSDCLWPAGPGDSGSAIFAKIGGVWKIIGLIFAGAGDYSQGYACRIDYIAEQLGIEAWDGTINSTSFIDPNSIEVIVTSGVSQEDSITVNGKVYRQGVATQSAPTV
jgi:hypothetical protein